MPSSEREGSSGHMRGRAGKTTRPILANFKNRAENARMIERAVERQVVAALERQAAVAIIGPRQVGKTTLALKIARSRPSVYLDLEAPQDLAKLQAPELLFERHAEKLIILDEIHRTPDLFQVLRGVIDQARRSGRRTGLFLILGSASVALLRQSGESLAGRIAYVEMGPVTAPEVAPDRPEQDRLWLRGGFPDSLLAASDADSFVFRQDLVRTYLERDVPQLGPRVPAETLRRLWTMLAHNQGQLLNASRLAASFGASSTTVARYIDLLVDLLLLRRLEPLHANVGKRLVRSPKIYVRGLGDRARAATSGDARRSAWAPGRGLELGGLCNRGAACRGAWGRRELLPNGGGRRGGPCPGARRLAG